MTETPPLDGGADTVTALDLESRIRHRRAALIDKIGGLRGDVRPEAVESRGRLKARLNDLTHILKYADIADWAIVSAPLTDTLERWLVDSARQLATKNEQP